MEPDRQEDKMAESEARGLNPAMDYAEHERTYRMFLRLVQYTLAGVAVILALLALFFG
jgi:hypothetical protein